jgi:nickel/cobalt exporter
MVITFLLMLISGFTAAFVGLVHSLAPGHWLPVVLMAKSRRWPLKSAILGACTVASGHILLSLSLGLLSIAFEWHFLSHYEEAIERLAGVGLGLFGLLYATYAYFRHSSCHGHTHHGPDPRGQKAPFVFLFSLGFSPCVAALPVFLSAAAQGGWAETAVALVAFSIGVLTALIGATVLVSFGFMKLDHPLFEHYGDVITGLSVAGMGCILFFV